jgi:hypothetical protein
MDLTGLTVWRCPDGHVMGQVKRNGHKVQRLLLYRTAISEQLTANSQMEEVDVMAVVEGLVMDVRCSICGGIRTWRPMEDKRRPQISRIFTDFPERG